ncbi:MAG: hypothetical protein P1P86_12585 [Bacteroidales bacterium]|nr:hypothetical protein [Bacteroidales bacterium]
MKRHSNQPFRFWKELKRRGVLRVLTMYAATAFIIMEAADIMFPRLGLPDWTVTFIIILLIAGLPVAFVLSWVFDITPQGLVKTPKLEEQEITRASGVPGRRKLRLSDVVIVLLLGIVLVLVYPKFFGKGRSKPERGGISIAVLPFKNMTGDTLYNLWQGGLQNLLITSLSNSEALSVRQYETMYNILGEEAGLNYASLTPAVAGEAARKAEANTVIIGNMYKSGDKIRVTSNIMNPESEEIYKSFELQGARENDFFVLADSLSHLIKDFLEIRSLKSATHYELKSVFTQSPEAYRLYLLGANAYARLDYPEAIEYFSKALETDSGFVSAMLKIAYCYGDTRQAVRSKEWAYKANEQILRLTPDMQLQVNALIATVEKKPVEQVYYLEEYLAIHPQAMIKHYQLGWVKFNMEEWKEAIHAFEKCLELAQKQEVLSWSWTYSLLGNAYHYVGAHKKEQRIYEKGRELWPQQKSTFDYWQAVCATSRGDSIRAKFYLDEIRKMTEQQGWPEANLWLWYAGVYDWAGSYEQAEYYHRKAYSMRSDNPMVIGEFAHFLIARDIKLEEGMNLIMPLVEEYPENASYQYTYGLGLYKRKEYEKAREVLQKSWSLRAYYDHKNFVLLKEVEDILDRNQG